LRPAAIIARAPTHFRAEKIGLRGRVKLTEERS
jgi:hypothetical protein